LANKKSAKKRIRSNARKAQFNKAVRTRSRTAVKKAREALADGDPAEARKAALAAVGELDRSARKGVIHPNNAARRKSRLIKSLRALEKPSE